jgi:hypothetical protein
MRRNINRRPHRVATSAVVVMLVFRFVVGEPESGSPTSGVPAQARAHTPGSVTWEWRLERIVRPQS